MHVNKPTKSRFFAELLIMQFCAVFLTAVLAANTIQAQVFTQGGRYETGSAQYVVTGDFDGDNDIDLAANQFDEDTIYIHLNDGAGGFAEILKFEAPRDGGLGVDDFNNDGFDDLVLYDGGWLDDDWGITVYLNNGDLTFSRMYQDTIGSTNFVTADFDGDGFIDIAVQNADYYDPNNRGIWIYYGAGDGNFAAPVSIVPTTSAGPQAGDVDDDGDVDLLFAVAGDAFCRLNNGDGTFADPLSTETSGVLGRLTELNGDQFPDMLYRQIYGCSGRPASYIGNGDGTFSGPHRAWVTAGLLSGINLVAADFNFDGYPDIALSAPEYSYVEVGLNDGRLNFERWMEHVPMTAGGLHLATADFDGDGDIDLAAIGVDDTLEVAFSLGAQHDRTIVVPDDAATVQEAVDMAWNLDTILVCPGIYYGSIDFDGKNLVLMSTDCSGSAIGYGKSDALSRAEETILDGGGTDRILTFDDFEDDRSVVSGFTIQNSHGEGYGGAIYCYDTAAPTITYNIIRNNYATSAGGAIFVHTGAATVSHNLIIDNSSGFIGGALYVSSSSAEITNNTICGNSTEEGGGGLYLGYGTPRLCNNIFWGNSSTINEQEIECGSAELEMTYSVVQGGWPGLGNIDSDPMFVDPDNYDFNLLEGSPCINAGDPNMPTDPDGTVSDIGAFYYPLPVGADDDASGNLPSHYSLIQNYPNPFNPVTIIQYSLPKRSHVTIEVYNLLGQKVRILIDGEESAGTYTVTWDGTSLSGESVSTGIYFYRFQAGDYVETKKMLLLK
jgi:hypothetical protein